MKRGAEKERLLRAWLCDLQLFASVFLARFMVWRELRRKDKALRKSRAGVLLGEYRLGQPQADKTLIRLGRHDC